MNNTITDTLNLTSEFRKKNSIYKEFKFSDASSTEFILFFKYVCNILISDSIVHYLNESFKHKHIYDNDMVCDIICAEIVSNHKVSTLYIYSGLDHTNVPNKLKELLELNLIMVEPSREAVKLTNHLEVICDADLLNASWLIKFLPTYNSQFKDITISENAAMKIFNQLRLVQSYDYRLGVKNYSPYIAYLGTANLPASILNNNNLKKTLLSMDTEGKVYKNLKENLGDDIDYFIQITKLGGI